ncbi:MAG TPA: DNA polymerase I [Alphaproteobacteria bacterium]|nr:DNA polymerase I [Alphaproteobacteria bacterium]
MTQKQKVIIIDGYNFLFRAFYAIRELTREDGLHTNALYGLANMTLKAIDYLQPDMCVVALDSGKKTFRNEIYSEYKANRKAPPEELMQQFEYVEPLLQSLGVQVLKEPGFEADDIIATFAAKIDREKYDLVIVSSDKDLMQLINGQVYMFDAGKQMELRAEEVMDKFGVTPDKVVEVQALIGDSVDNIPGVKSVGPKTAAQLINEYGNLENLYENIENITKAKLKENLTTYKENAFLSRELATLKTDIYPQVNEYLLNYEITTEKAVEYTTFLGFKTLAKKLAEGFLVKDPNAIKPSVNSTEESEEQQSNIDTSNYQLVNTIDMLDVWVERLYDSEYFAIDTETDSLDGITANLVGISLATEHGKACYIPLEHNTATDMFSTNEDQLDRDLVLEKLKPVLASEDIIKVGQNIKYDMHVLTKYGVEFNNIDDTMVMSFVLNGGKHRHNMDDLSNLYLNHKTIKFSELGLKKGQTFADLEPKFATVYAAEDADITLRLYDVFAEKLAKEPTLAKMYTDIERPVIKTLFNMEQTGVNVDLAKLNELSADFTNRAEVLQQEIYDLAGVDFNISSPKQLGEVLFDTLAIPGGKKTKTGWKTGQEVLDKLVEEGYEIAKKIEEFRHLTKLKTTYVDSLPAYINKKTGRIHTSYKQTGASTGRLASSDPNLQNIPIRTTDGQKIRQAFIPAQGYSFVSIDYSQAELRILAHMANIKPLIEAFNNDKDIHSFTAMKLFGSTDDEFRRKAKAVNFGIVYGMGPFSLAKQIGVTNAEGKAIIEEYYRMFSGLEQFMSEQKQKASDLGYVETIYGRRIHLPEASSTNKMVQANAMRGAVNAPMQGANADIMKIIMPKIEAALEEKYPQAKMLMQIHDELVFTIPDHCVEKVSEFIKDIMENSVDLAVKFKADIGVGKNWNDAH